jgi:hypothetical protein
MTKIPDINMNKNISIVAFVCVLILLSCETEPILFSGPYHVRFTESALTKKESFSDVIKIEVHNVGTALKEDVTINYGVSGTARNGIDYVIQGTTNSITIKKGQYFGYIEVKLLNNANNILRSQNIVFTLQSANKSELEIGQGPSAIGKTFTLTIEDDCLLSGTYSGTKNVFDIPIEGISISSNDCENYFLSNWNIDIFSPPYDYSLTFVDNGDNTLTIEEQGTNTKLKGRGIIDPITRKITMTIVFIDFDNEEVTITLTPN